VSNLFLYVYSKSMQVMFRSTMLIPISCSFPLFRKMPPQRTGQAEELQEGAALHGEEGEALHGDEGEGKELYITKEAR
jgi:hypothetical protein